MNFCAVTLKGFYVPSPSDKCLPFLRTLLATFSRFCVNLLLGVTRQCNISRLFQVLTQFSFTISKIELHYYHKRVNVCVTSRIAKLLETLDVRKWGNFKKIHNVLRIHEEYLLGYPKSKFWQLFKKIAKNKLQNIQ